MAFESWRAPPRRPACHAPGACAPDARHARAARTADGPCLRLHARDGAAHDQAVPPHAPVPLGPNALDAHILEARLGEPLRAARMPPVCTPHQASMWCVSGFTLTAVVPLLYADT